MPNSEFEKATARLCSIPAVSVPLGARRPV